MPPFTPVGTPVITLAFSIHSRTELDFGSERSEKKVCAKGVLLLVRETGERRDSTKYEAQDEASRTDVDIPQCVNVVVQ